MAAPPELAAWYDFCDRIRTLGERVLGHEFPNTPSDRPEAIAHLADQLSCWLGWAIGHGDTTAPFFHRSNDLVTQWGGPNQDNAYHHARIDPARRYRIRGQMHSCEEFVLTLRVGFMHMEEWGTKATVTASERGIGRGDSFELLLGGDGSLQGLEDPQKGQILPWAARGGNLDILNRVIGLLDGDALGLDDGVMEGNVGDNEGLAEGDDVGTAVQRPVTSRLPPPSLTWQLF